MPKASRGLFPHQFLCFKYHLDWYLGNTKITSNRRLVLRCRVGVMCIPLTHVTVHPICGLRKTWRGVLLCSSNGSTDRLFGVWSSAYFFFLFHLSVFYLFYFLVIYKVVVMAFFRV